VVGSQDTQELSDPLHIGSPGEDSQVLPDNLPTVVVSAPARCGLNSGDRSVERATYTTSLTSLVDALGEEHPSPTTSPTW
jgi:hypothetical protein